jgi:hypothetical protein
MHAMQGQGKGKRKKPGKHKETMENERRQRINAARILGYMRQKSTNVK